ncbi:hypothetical protein P8C59_007179 [Phyllachora maydis]|uniref:C2H2-type domain-containing protein n=1 Tax=Phyllachora maydis TaxID=1825666 RepID=A0AAD9I8Z5_9PEZI|nr:hypothetical protein P8C59_007179 [Phyllachora maydis]
MPPTSTLPAEFECQLCYLPKKFQKPSDWTKHVHEDVQPFTCTWDGCREPKMFKRKADWVRHENEGHRHLEWWTCDIDDCKHTCYRRDNFLQHLVREHKFPEPKTKTKAAIKRAGSLDPIWQKVESCHEPTQALPQEEPCRFCGRAFPTWKKLTVHLAKHMEQISLPVLRLVTRRELEPNTVISPVQDPPRRPFPVTYPSTDCNIKRETSPFDGLAFGLQAPLGYGHGDMSYHIASRPQPQQQPPQQQEAFMPFSMPAGNSFTQAMYASTVGGLPSTAGPGHHMGVQQVGHSFSNMNPQTYNVPVTTGTYLANPNQYIPVGSAPDLEPFPAMTMDALGLQNPSEMSAFSDVMGPSNGCTSHHYTTPRSHSDSPNPGQGGGRGFIYPLLS